MTRFFLSAAVMAAVVFAAGCAHSRGTTSRDAQDRDSQCITYEEYRQHLQDEGLSDSD